MPFEGKPFQIGVRIEHPQELVDASQHGEGADARLLGPAYYALVCRAEAAHGPLAEGQVYYLVIPGLLGGKYSEENIRKITLQEVLSYCGDMAQQMESVPEGTEVKIVLKE